MTSLTTDFSVKIVNHGRTPENTSPVKSRQSLTNGIPINSGELHQIHQQPVINSMRLLAMHGPTYQHCHEHAHYINPEHLSEQDPTHLQLYAWDN